MSKKRVHEIAKELKAQGIELDNKEVVSELVSFGYDVKSHSSSLEDDQATAAIQKIADCPGVGIKKARQVKSSAENYLLEEAKLRAELNAERAAQGQAAPPPPEAPAAAPQEAKT